MLSQPLTSLIPVFVRRGSSLSAMSTWRNPQWPTEGECKPERRCYFCLAALIWNFWERSMELLGVESGRRACEWASTVPPCRETGPSVTSLALQSSSHSVHMETWPSAASEENFLQWTGAKINTLAAFRRQFFFFFFLQNQTNSDQSQKKRGPTQKKNYMRK